MEQSKTDLVAGAVYEHYKGQQYRVIGVGLHTETLEEVVMYEALYDNPLGRLWCRPLKMWLESVEVNGQSVPRFKFLFR